MPHLVATALAGAALALSPPGGDPAPLTGMPTTSLRLTVTHPGLDTSSARSVTLQCDPAGGTHPDVAGACADLAGSGGRIERPVPATVACTMIHAPVVAEATGWSHGRPVTFRREYANDCALHASTGSIFRF